MKPNTIILTISFVVPIIAKAIHPELFSLSHTIYYPYIYPLFIVMTTGASLLMIQFDKWIVSGIILVLLTAFNMKNFPLIHDILAYSFFLSCFVALYRIKRFRLYAWAFFGLIPVYFVFGLFWAEVFGIYVINVYHIHVKKFVT